MPFAFLYFEQIVKMNFNFKLRILAYHKQITNIIFYFSLKTDRYVKFKAHPFLWTQVCKRATNEA